MNIEPPVIDETLARRLVEAQFPQWAGLPVRQIVPGGWDNKTFRLGDHMIVRLPGAARHAGQVDNEQRWLPKLARCLPLRIPTPLAIGEPAHGFPWRWSVYGWIDGDTATPDRIRDGCDFAARLAQFLIALRRMDSTGGPAPGTHNFHRGGHLAHYDAQTREALAALAGKIDVATATEVWQAALGTTWQRPPVWVHGDIAAGNLLVRDGRLSAVIDFGQLAVGDPACDLAITWTLFSAESRDLFRDTLALDSGTWARARAWTLWKAMIVAAGLVDTNAVESKHAWRIIDDVLAEHQRSGASP